LQRHALCVAAGLLTRRSVLSIHEGHLLMRCTKKVIRKV
jgi:hypothetical protein